MSNFFFLCFFLCAKVVCGMEETIENQLVIPGTRIGDAEDYEAGPGTYVRHKYVYSSLVGKVEISGAQGEKPTISVARSAEPSLVPAVGSIVTGSFQISFCWSLFSLLILFLVFFFQVK